MRIGVAALAALAGCGDGPPAAIDAPPLVAIDAAPPIDAPAPTGSDAAVATCVPVAGDTIPSELLPPGTVAQPVLVTAPAGDRRLFVVERAGRIRIVDQGVVQDAPFLDLRSDLDGPVLSTGTNRGCSASPSIPTSPATTRST